MDANLLLEQGFMADKPCVSQLSLSPKGRVTALSYQFRDQLDRVRGIAKTGSRSRNTLVTLVHVFSDPAGQSAGQGGSGQAGECGPGEDQGEGQRGQQGQVHIKIISSTYQN